jgi:hypothetical protein
MECPRAFTEIDFLVLLILIYFFLQIFSADCDTCIVIEIVGLLNIKIVYICLYANEMPSTRDPIYIVMYFMK